MTRDEYFEKCRVQGLHRLPYRKDLVKRLVLVGWYRLEEVYDISLFEVMLNLYLLSVKKYWWVKEEELVNNLE